MKALFSALALLGALGAGMAHADISVSMRAPGLMLHIGDRDNHGNYWTGHAWCPPTYWREHYVAVQPVHYERYRVVEVDDRYHRDWDRWHDHGRWHDHDGWEHEDHDHGHWNHWEHERD